MTTVTYNSLKRLFEKQINDRSNIENDGNGHQKIGCVVFNLKSKEKYCLLRDWMEPL